ncbi:MAG: hypothetical protein ACQETQ_03795 [Spirochaetota bacterium]
MEGYDVTTSEVSSSLLMESGKITALKALMARSVGFVVPFFSDSLWYEELAHIYQQFR